MKKEIRYITIGLDEKTSELIDLDSIIIGRILNVFWNSHQEIRVYWFNFDWFNHMENELKNWEGFQ